MENNLNITSKFNFSVKNFDGIDIVKLKAEEQKILVKSHYPIDYQGKEVELGLIEFFDELIGYTFGNIVIGKAERYGCNTGSILASIFLGNQDQIPKEWDAYHLVFPGTVWTDPNGHRGLTVLYKENNEWTFTFVAIDGMPSFLKSRFVYDCRQMEFPQKIETKKEEAS